VLAFQCRLLPKAPDPGLAFSPTPAAPRVYTVVVGDSLSKIAAKFYGNATQWQKLYDANRPVIGKDPNMLKAGMRLTVP
jgi:nucleoid-associated protein YgaU